MSRFLRFYDSYSTVREQEDVLQLSFFFCSNEINIVVNFAKDGKTFMVIRSILYLFYKGKVKVYMKVRKKYIKIKLGTYIDINRFKQPPK